MFNNPLDNIRVASPCPANWNEMFGDERKRFCSECKLNVYNLSGMTRQEAEGLVFNHEGRLCVRFFKRADGTVLTADCPVGWARIKRKVSRAATAVATIVFGFAGGLLGVTVAENLLSPLSSEAVPAVPINSDPESSEVTPMVGEAILGDVDLKFQGQVVLGRQVEPLRKIKVRPQ